MTENNPTPLPASSEPAKAESMSWLDIWGYALTKPATTTFTEILQDPKAKSSPYLWVGLASLLGYIIAALLQSLFGSNTLGTVSEQLGSQVGAASAFTTICCAPVSAIFAVGAFALSVGIYHLVAKMFQGQGTFSQLAFTMASFHVPLTVISLILAAIPWVSILTIPIGIYTIILTILAVKATHQFTTGKAVAVVVIPAILGVIIGLSIATLLPLIRENFQNLNLPTY